MMGRKDTSHRPFCAICAAETNLVSKQPLGKNGALVNVCWDCAEERPKVKNTYRDYEPTGGYLSASDIKHLPESPAELKTKVPVMRPLSTGYVLVRVPKQKSARRQYDWKEAMETLRDKPWYRSLHVIGSDARFFLFERPEDPKLWLADDGSDFDAHLASSLSYYHSAQPEEGKLGAMDGTEGRRNRRHR